MAVIIGTVGDDDGVTNPALTGSAGDDTINGLDGNDVIDAGDGNDRVRLGAGNDSADGGAGDDVYSVSGQAGDSVQITDLAGNDTISVAAAGAGATVNLGPRNTIVVDGRTIQTTVRGADESVLDFMLLQDLSGSFADDVRVLAQLAPQIVADLTGIFDDARLGVASFVDKPRSPFGSSGDYVYQTDVALDADTDAFVAGIRGLRIRNGNDGPESQLEALMQLALRTGEVGWRALGVKIAVVTTDADFHVAGDFASAPDNNGDDVLDGTPPGTGEDYPTTDQVRDALEAAGITPVFAVAGTSISDYQALVADWGFGEVVALTGNSSNLDQAIREVIQTQGQTLIENAIGSDFDDSLIGNTVGNNLRGRDGDDTLTGKSGDDSLSGGDAADRLFGGDGDDFLSGGAGVDFAYGGAGKDSIRSGAGDDRMFGGSGGDRFLIRESDLFDHIVDFDVLSDVLILSAVTTGIANLADLAAATRARPLATDIALEGGGLLRLTGVAAVDLDAGNVLFVA